MKIYLATQTVEILCPNVGMIPTHFRSVGTAVLSYVLLCYKFRLIESHLIM